MEIFINLFCWEKKRNKKYLDVNDWKEKDHEFDEQCWTPVRTILIPLGR